MPEQSNRLVKFWNELKRRKVFRVIVMYAGAVYIIIELVNNVAEPLHLPEWTATLVILLLIIGFPIVAILSWIFDMTPEGLKKTEPAKGAKGTTAKPVKRRIRVSDGIIALLVVVVCILLYPKIFQKDKFENIRNEDGRISVAVMPFNNLTIDTLFNIWQQGLQNLLITSLSNSEELSVRQAQTINDILGNKVQTNYASIEPSFAKDIAAKLKARTVIIGNIHKSGNQVRITANLMDSRTEEMYKSFEVNGDSENDFFVIIDSLSSLLINYLEIESLEQDLPIELRNAFSSSADAYKHYLQGRNYHGVLDYSSAIEQYKKALEIDSTFVLPMLFLAHSFRDIGQSDQSKKWAYKAFDQINKVPKDIQLEIRELKAMVDKKPKEQLSYINQYFKINPYSTQKLYTAGWINYNMNQWQNAIEAFEKGLELNEYLGGKIRLWVYYYTLLGNAYNKIGDNRKALKTFEDGLEIWPNDPLIIFWQSVCTISQGDSSAANEYLSKLNKIALEQGWPEVDKLWWIALCYASGNNFIKAEEVYRQALSLDKNNIGLKNNFAYFLIFNDIDVEEGFELILSVLKKNPDYWDYLYTYGLGLYKKEEDKEAHEILKKAWDLRPSYSHEHYLLLQEVEQTLAREESRRP